jgi:hypothetical protein
MDTLHRKVTTEVTQAPWSLILHLLCCCCSGLLPMNGAPKVPLSRFFSLNRLLFICCSVCASPDRSICASTICPTLGVYGEVARVLGMLNSSKMLERLLLARSLGILYSHDSSLYVQCYGKLAGTKELQFLQPPVSITTKISHFFSWSTHFASNYTKAVGKLFDNGVFSWRRPQHVQPSCA